MFTLKWSYKRYNIDRGDTMNLYDAICYRYSVRKYKPLIISETHQKSIHDFFNTLESISSRNHINVELFEADQRFEDLFKGVTNGYFRVKAPHYICFSTNDYTQDNLLNIGYLGEKISLYLTTLGIGSCWLGTPIDKDAFSMLTSHKNDEYVIMMAIGYPEKELSPILSRKRLPLNKLVSENYPSVFNHVVDAFVASPSAVNVQPWKLSLTPQIIEVKSQSRSLLSKIFVKKYRAIDLGIAICHINEALDEEGFSYDQHIISSSHCKWYLT